MTELTVPCKYCGRPTTYTTTRECDTCHGASVAPVATLRKILAERDQWTAYKPGDVVPAGIHYWVMVHDDRFNYSRRNPFIVVRNEDGKGGDLFYDSEWGGIDDLVTHYIAIPAPELPK